ncbi:uncharacterized protein LOC113216018 isoform X1 [Frankliniella occidentalis]|uniref:Uncharacterized protein LOC113216018 isoform X1 n=1 Tax=Frankliniella occidentalis TaxID=133901 RepID=A0A9C6XW22_FRAOC|nr:uncharacterized protein LOC113216018 isoform X1 [Frankliniella occidentalis]
MTTVSDCPKYYVNPLEVNGVDLNEDGQPYSQWSDLPNLILEQVFTYLDIKERYAASQVCRNWYIGAFYLPNTWSTFLVTDTTLTRRRYNYFLGWQQVLDNTRVPFCLQKIGGYIRTLIFDRMIQFQNLYDFMNKFTEFNEAFGSKLHTLRFNFCCDMDMEERERQRVYGTGGKVLESLKNLMRTLTSLRRLELRDLMLNVLDGQKLLDEVCDLCTLTLRELVLVNATEYPCQLLHVGVFLNLEVLVISPQNLGEDALILLGQTKLRHLHILQNSFTPSELMLFPVAGKAWKMCRKDNPGLSVHLKVESLKEREVVWQEKAPVRSIIYNSPLTKIQSQSVMTIIDLYSQDLRAYGHLGLPRFQRSRSFHERVDALLLLLVRQSVWLHTLVIRERISTATVLLLAKTGCNLQNLMIRRNAVILRCDWPRSPDWSEEFYQWLKVSSRSYEATEKEVSQLLGAKWRMLTDKQFKVLTVDLHNLK